MPTGRDFLAELLAAVDMLTKERVEEIFQSSDGRTWRTKITSPALIKQLRDSIVSTVGTHPVGGTLPNQRSVLDSDSYERYKKMVSSIGVLYGGQTAASQFPTPEQNLRIWYIGVSNQYRVGKISDTNLKNYVRLLEGWVAMIDNKLNPPETLDIIAPCPVCLAIWAEEGGERVRAIQIVYRLGIDRSVSSTRGKCRACSAAWKGTTGLQKLREMIDEKTQNILA